jgi:hypothetical protein
VTQKGAPLSHPQVVPTCRNFTDIYLSFPSQCPSDDMEKMRTILEMLLKN